MKHIKTYGKFTDVHYQLFESSKEDDEVKDYLKDIFLEAQDMGLPVKIESMTGLIQGIFKYMKEPLLYRITIGDKERTPDAKPFYLKDVCESILMAKSYMSEEGEVNKVFKGKGYNLSKVKAKSASLLYVVLGSSQRYMFDGDNILNNILSYEKGEGELFDEPIVSLEIDFKRKG
jgi:hypothetical protein